ncbi:hypothetical protein [Nocardioides humi]|uniref:hypothetical protein n=1 Tax=Nocardioides humi TaxID=449461 RepID=UPI00112BC60E|nr:hypothetical protein [Nocardioides humi]
MVVEGIIEYYRQLGRSARPRIHFVGRSPDDENEWWYFEAVDVDGELIAIRQVTIEASGDGHRYSAEHIEDVWGGLTDQAIDYEDQLERCAASVFADAWDRAASDA